MPKNGRFWTLVMGVVLVVLGTLTALYEHIIPLWPAIAGFFASIGKKLGTLAFWKQVPVFLGKWSFRTVWKLLLRGVFTVITAIVVMALFRSATRKRVKAYLMLVKQRFLARFEATLAWFDNFFGFTGVVSFTLSLMIAAAMLVWTFIYFDGFALFVWVGSWGPLAPVWAAIGDFILHRIPYLHRFIAWGSRVWQLYLSRFIPNPFPWLRKKFRRTLRHARRVKHMSIAQRTELWERLRARRERKRQRRRKEVRDNERLLATDRNRKRL